MFIDKTKASTSGQATFTITKGKNSYLLSDEPLSPVNKEKIIKDFNIVEEARKSAAKELPASGSTSLSPTEQKIQDIYQEIITVYAQYTDSVLTHDDKQMQLDRNDVINSENDARIVPTEFSNSLGQIVNGFNVQLKHEKELIYLASNEFENFRKENKLDRPCKEISNKQSFFIYLVLVAIVIVEGFLNAKLFSTNMEGGLLEGFLYAFIFSLVNAIVCFLIGKVGTPYIFHVKKSLKLIGVISIIFFLVFVTFFGLFVGHYREALQISMENASTLGWQTFKENPFGLKDMMSWVLFGVTIIMGSTAFFDGLNSRDKYPGYEEKNKKFKEARERWEDFYASVVNTLNDHQSACLEKFETAVSRAQNALASIKASFLEKETILNRYSNAHKNAQKSIRSIVGQYRYENQLYRTSPAPAYFNEFDIFDYDYIPPVIAGKSWSKDITNEIKVGEKDIAALNKLVDKLCADKLQIEKDIITSFKEQRGSIDANYGEVLTNPGKNSGFAQCIEANNN